MALEINYNCFYLYFLLSLLEAALQLIAYKLTAGTKNIIHKFQKPMTYDYDNIAMGGNTVLFVL